MGAPPLGAIVGVAQNVLTLVFWAMIAADHAGHVSVIDDEYKATGFCRATDESHGFDSFQLCFVVDTLGCLVLLYLWQQRGAAGVVGPAASIFFHGVFHMSQYMAGWPMPPRVEMVVFPIFTLAFVGGFGVGTKVGSPIHTVVVASAIELFRRAYVSDPFAFAYANAWIYVSSR